MWWDWTSTGSRGRGREPKTSSWGTLLGVLAENLELAGRYMTGAWLAGPYLTGPDLTGPDLTDEGMGCGVHDGHGE